MTYFEVANLHKSFGGLIAVNDLCFKLAKGQIVGIIGPNGAGKTTLFNLISGFLQPDRGDVLWKGENIVGKKPDQIANIGISRTFQIVKPFRDLTIYENLKVACYGKRFLKKCGSILWEFTCSCDALLGGDNFWIYFRFKFIFPSCFHFVYLRLLINESACFICKRTENYTKHSAAYTPAVFMRSLHHESCD